MTGQHPYVEIARDASGVATIALQHPERGNALDGASIAELRQALETLESDPSVKVLVIRAKGQNFCTGADLEWLEALAHGSPAAREAASAELLGLLEGIRLCGKPVIAMPFGVCAGGGAGLVAACDYAIAQPGTSFYFSNHSLGIRPSPAAAAVIARLGPDNAKKLFVHGSALRGREAQSVGLVQEVAPHGEQESLLEEAIAAALAGGKAALADMRAARPRGELPMALPQPRAITFDDEDGGLGERRQNHNALLELAERVDAYLQQGPQETEAMHEFMRADLVDALSSPLAARGIRQFLEARERRP